MINQEIKNAIENPDNFDFIMDTMIGVMEKNVEYDTKSTPFTNPDILNKYLLCQFKGNRKNEVFACIFLDNKLRLISFSFLTEGTVNQAVVYPRVVVQQCIKHNASAVVFAHNHPSNDLLPSQSDIAITNKLHKILEVIDVRVLDHFIVGSSRAVSMQQMGYI